MVECTKCEKWYHRMCEKIPERILVDPQSFTEIIETNAKNGVVLEKPQAIENSFKRAYGEVEDNIIIYIERLKT